MITNFRILLTENCNATCKNCFNSGYRSGKDMSLEEFKKVSDFLRRGGVHILKMMGGEPFVNKEFDEIYKEARRRFDYITIFTNGLSNKILTIPINKKINFVYNFELIRPETFDIKKLRLDSTGGRHLEVQIPSDIDIVDINNRIAWLKDEVGEELFRERITINLTLNCMENIYEHREIIMAKWKIVARYCMQLGFKLNIDHAIPRCFPDRDMQSLIDIIRPEKITGCHDRCPGLIDADLNLRYCNQHPVILGHIDDYPRMKDVNETLRENMKIKNKITYDKMCEGCSNANTSCTGGCFNHKEFMIRGD